MFFVGCVRHSYLPPSEADADRDVHMRVFRLFRVQEIIAVHYKLLKIVPDNLT